MVDLAGQAFHTKNYELAAEFYCRTIRENGPTAELYLGLADSLACGGHFQRAFEAYFSAFRLGTITHDKLKHLLFSLIQKVQTPESSTCIRVSRYGIFSCTLCFGLLTDPVTIPCGHTFCRRCLQQDKTLPKCRNCEVVHDYLKLADLKTNVLLTQIIDKWFPNERTALALRKEGNAFFKRKKFERAIELYSDVIQLVPHDHLTVSNRSHAYANKELYGKASADADTVVKLCPSWPKGYFRKGCALYGVSRYEETIVSFLQCLSLDPSITRARSYLSKALHNFLSTPPPDDPKSAALSDQLHPSQLQRLMSSNFSLNVLLPQITSHTLSNSHRVVNGAIATNQTENRTKTYLENIYLEANTKEHTWQERCRSSSAPGSQIGSPILPRKLVRSRSRSTSPPAAERRRLKRCRSSTTVDPRSPTHELPLKFCKPQTRLINCVVQIDPSLQSRDDFDCSLCYRLLYHPVTTPCGHVFCRQCLDRCLDHRTSCPMCKSSLVEYLAERRQAMTETIVNILQDYFPLEYQERQKLHEEELAEIASMESDNQIEIPIFVCTMSYPTVPCMLHIFEPRYRLMMRRCIESGVRQFGMCICLDENEENFAECGCILEITDFEFFSDGRSLVQSVGVRRFKVLSRSRRDGYNMAKVEFVQDSKVDGSQLEELKALQNEVYNLSKSWFDSLPRVHQEPIRTHFGPFPPPEEDPQASPNGPAWAWWVTAVLPLDTRIQLAMLAMVSFRERLQVLKRILSYLNNRNTY